MGSGKSCLGVNIGALRGETEARRRSLQLLPSIPPDMYALE